MEYKIGYQISKEGYYLGEKNIRENPRKKGDFSYYKNIIFNKPPKEKSKTIRQWTGEKWIYIPDNRGIWWNKKTSEQFVIDNIGELVSTEDTDVPPDGRFLYQYFNDLTNVWEENVIEKERVEKEQRIIKLQNQLKELDIKKIRYIIEKEKGDLSGKKYFDAYEKETLLLRNQLKEIENESTMFA